MESEIEIVAPGFLKIGPTDLINLNNVKRIEIKKMGLTRGKDNDDLIFHFSDGDSKLFQVYDAEEIFTQVARSWDTTE